MSKLSWPVQSTHCVPQILALADGETLVVLHRQIERLTAAATRAVAAFDAGRAWSDDGAHTASAWLRERWNVPATPARRRVKLGRALREMPAVEAAWLAGDIGEAQVALLVSARTPQTASCFERDEKMLVEQARKLGYRSFARALAYWEQLADPDGAERSAERQHADRRLGLSQTFGGAWSLEGLFDPINGAVVANVLGRIDKELFEADWAEARERVGEKVCAGDLARTPAQRRADALVEMARRAAAMPRAPGCPSRCLACWWAMRPSPGASVSWRTARWCRRGRWRPGLDRAWVERVVFDGPKRIKDVGVRTRVFTGATRRAVQLRDRECFHPYCDRVAEDCEIDHVRPWSEGGLTVEENGRVACGFHNRERHRSRPPP